MRTEKFTLSIRSDRPGLFLLMLVSLCIGLYLVLTTVIISRDGITYIRYAQQIPTMPRETLLREYQHPGYPFLILCFHAIVGIFVRSPFHAWILSAQLTAVLFKTLACAVLYYWGKTVTDKKTAFTGVLVFLFLPIPARIGSDALSDWPSLLMLAAGILCLMVGIRRNRAVYFVLTGLLSGIGYLIRPETIQLTIYGCIMAFFLYATGKIRFLRCCLLVSIVVIMSGLFSAPYMTLKGSFFPKKNLLKPADPQTHMETPSSSDVFRAGPVQTVWLSGAGKLFENLGETYMWYFSFFWILGAIRWFGRQEGFTDCFFVGLIIILNVFMLLLLNASYGYLHYRHTLGLFAITFFFVPVGLQAAADAIHKKYPAWKQPILLGILLVLGICICLPKLMQPLKTDKKAYRQAASWLQQHMQEDEIVSVSDPRIGFYAQHQWIPESRKNLSKADWAAHDHTKDEEWKRWNPVQEFNLIPVKTFTAGDQYVAVYQKFKR